ncbi:MAG: GDP-mannose 4,6-dehydratase [Pirellulales bacterium]|nr:GDP-mannose 4,6-dehydratase [Pirellulales bacterium]
MSPNRSTRGPSHCQSSQAHPPLADAPREIRCLVTGGAGFIGSHLAEALLTRGRLVTVIDDESTGTIANLTAARRSDRLRFVRGAISDEPLMRQLVSNADEVYHLAAAVGVALIADDPIRTIETNINPTDLLLRIARDKLQGGGQVRLFLASTSEVYGKNPKPSWTEDDDLVLGPTTRPRWAYGASKAIDEFLALAYWRQQSLPVVVGRFFNVVGPRQTGQYGMVLPRFVDAALAGRSLIVHDDGRQLRCFAHVSDVVAAVLALMDSQGAAGRVFNIGSDQPVSILELAQRVIAAAQSTSGVEFQSYAAAYSADFEDVRSRVPDLTRLRDTIGYAPRYDLNAIIADVVRWKRESAS